MCVIITNSSSVIYPKSQALQCKNHTLKYKVVDRMKCMVRDKYGKKTGLGWNEYNVEVLDAIHPLEWINIEYQLNYEHATAIWVQQE